jgi:hypothetical protein
VSAKVAELASQENGSMARRRFQKGRIFVRGKKRPVFVGRWRADVIQDDGTIVRVERSIVLGPVSELKTEKMAERSFAPILRGVKLSRLSARKIREGFRIRGYMGNTSSHPPKTLERQSCTVSPEDVHQEVAWQRPTRRLHLSGSAKFRDASFAKCLAKNRAQRPRYPRLDAAKGEIVGLLLPHN